MKRVVMFFITLFLLSTLVAAQTVYECLTAPPAGTTSAQAQSGNLGFFKITSFDYELRLAIHIVRNSNGTGGISIQEIDARVQELNNLFTQTGISFVNHTTNYIDNSAFYNIDNLTEANSLRQQNKINGCINVYFVDGLMNLQGMSSFSPRIDNSGIQGVLIANTSSLSTLAHEIGHYFDLFHTFETLFGNENIDQDICTNWSTSGDLLYDTPADPSGRVTFSCIDNDCNWNPTKDVPVDGCGFSNYTPLTNNLMIDWSSK